MTLSKMRSTLLPIIGLCIATLFEDNAAAIDIQKNVDETQAIQAKHFSPKLSGRTTRYQHGVFGEDFEYTTLSLGDGLPEYTLANPDVFEDRQIRIVDINQNGKPDFLQVVSNQLVGARLMILEFDGTSLNPIAESKPIGTGNRWLNPIGTGDFENNGDLKIASVRTPHIGGILEIHELVENSLVKVYELGGVSNHIYGSRNQAMAGIIELQNEGDKIVIPNQTGTKIHLVGIKMGNLGVSSSIKASGRVNYLHANSKGQISYTTFNGPSNEVNYVEFQPPSNRQKP